MAASRAASAEMVVGQPVATHGRVAVENGVCAAGHQAAAQAGVRILQEGGNAVDALTAGAFTAFVVEPSACGIGGYAHITAWHAASGRFLSVDAYVRAPGTARPDMFEIDPGQPETYYHHPSTRGGLSEAGALAVAVPGAVAGFCHLQDALGTLPLSRVLEPAIEAARAGYDFDWSDVMHIAQRRAAIEALPDTAAAFLPDGGLPRSAGSLAEGSRLDTTALADSLEAIAREGAAAFYQGTIARTLVDHVRGLGGILTLEDLAGYRPRVLHERPTRYRGHDVVTCYDQVALEALNILEGYDLAAEGPDSLAYRHLMAEAMGVAFTDNIAHYGDPAFVESPVNGLASPAFAAERRKAIRPDRALPRPIAPGDPWPFEDEALAPEILPGDSALARRGGTTQVATADRQGNMAAACITIGNAWGSLVYVPEAGLLNDGMKNFDPRPGRPSSIAPGKMPIFAAPALVAVKDGRAVFAGSGSGGYQIETGVLHSLVNRIDHAMDLQQAVDHPRVHCQGRETCVDPRIPQALRQGLEKAGHQVRLLPQRPGAMNFGRVSAVAAEADGTLLAAAGPSWHTGIAGY